MIQVFMRNTQLSFVQKKPLTVTYITYLYLAKQPYYQAVLANSVGHLPICPVRSTVSLKRPNRIRTQVLIVSDRITAGYTYLETIQTGRVLNATIGRNVRLNP